MQSLILITQILIVGTLGYFLGPRLSQTLQKLVFKVLPYFSYLLLMAVAFEFSFAFHQLKDPQQILPTALILAFTTTCASFVVCMLAYQLLDRDSVQGKISFSLFLNAIKNISHACLALMLGELLAPSVYGKTGIRTLIAGIYCYCLFSSLGLNWLLHA